MFEPTSRYFDCQDLRLTREEDGRVIVYKERRFLPQAERMKSMQEIVVTAGDRLDLIAANILGDPEQFWRICDANNAMHPIDLTIEPGRVLRIALVER
jgi:nucleoid-associated protein YgaU